MLASLCRKLAVSREPRVNPSCFAIILVGECSVCIQDVIDRGLGWNRQEDRRIGGGRVLGGLSRAGSLLSGKTSRAAGLEGSALAGRMTSGDDGPSGSKVGPVAGSGKAGGVSALTSGFGIRAARTGLGYLCG